jgi:hypothetical protein
MISVFYGFLRISADCLCSSNSVCLRGPMIYCARLILGSCPVDAIMTHLKTPTLFLIDFSPCPIEVTHVDSDAVIQSDSYYSSNCFDSHGYSNESLPGGGVKKCNRGPCRTRDGAQLLTGGGFTYNSKRESHQKPQTHPTERLEERTVALGRTGIRTRAGRPRWL